jgi:hypothetical protein
MLVRLLTAISGPTGSFKPGDYITVSASEGASMIAAGVADVPDVEFTIAPTGSSVARPLGDILGWPLRDTFKSRDASALLKVADTGQAWATVPAAGVKVLPFIGSDLNVKATDSGQPTTAAYFGIDMGQPVSSMRSFVRWAIAGTDGGMVVLIANPNGLASVANVTDGPSIHVRFSNTQAFVDVYSGNVNTNLKTLTYPTPIAVSSDIYEVGWDYDGDRCLTLLLPNGRRTIIKDSGLIGAGGRFASFEHFWSTGQCQPWFTEVRAR